MTDDRPTIDPRTHPCVCHRGREAARNCPHHTLADYDEADAARDRPTIDRDAQQTAAEGEVSVRSTGVAPAEAVASPSAVPTIDRDDCANCAPRNATTPEAMTTEQMRYAWAGRDPALDALTKYAAQPDTGYSTTVRVPRHLLTLMFDALDAEIRRADALVTELNEARVNVTQWVTQHSAARRAEAEWRSLASERQAQIDAAFAERDSLGKRIAAAIEAAHRTAPDCCAFDTAARIARETA